MSRNVFIKFFFNCVIYMLFLVYFCAWSTMKIVLSIQYRYGLLLHAEALSVYELYWLTLIYLIEYARSAFCL